MAYIKLRLGLEQSVRFWGLCGSVGLDGAECLFHLYKLAGWFQANGKYGVMECESRLVDAYLKHDGFAAALADIGWLKEHDGPSLTLHGFTSVSSTRKSLGKKIRREILSSGECSACGCRDSKLVIDHKIPVCQGGPCTRENLQALCEPCNLAKGRKTMDEFMEDRQRA